MSPSRVWSAFGSLPRRAQALWGAALVALLLGGLLVAHAAQISSARGTTPPAALQGTDLGAAPAPDFTLKDQNGASVSLAQLRGRPIILTFFDSVCPHTDCSLMAQYLNASAQAMGAQQAQSVVWVAISLNPWHDTPASARSFLTSRNVAMPLRYLLGGVPELAPVWSAYHMQSILQPDGIVIHTTGVYLIDAQGRERIFLDEGFDPHMLSDDVHLLLTNPAVQAAPGGAAQGTGAVTQTQSVGGNTLTFIATPGQYGSYSFEVDAWDARGNPLQGASVTIALTMTQMNMGVVHVALKPLSSGDGTSYPGMYSAHGVVSMAGAWQAVVQVSRPGAAAPIQATFQFTAKY